MEGLSVSGVSPRIRIMYFRDSQHRTFQKADPHLILLSLPTSITALSRLGSGVRLGVWNDQDLKGNFAQIMNH